MKREHDKHMTLAWTTAALHRAKKMPKLETLLVSQKKRQQTPAEMKAALMQIFKHAGKPGVRH